MKPGAIGSWISSLETEIARELGQPVTIVPGGDAPDPRNGLSHSLPSGPGEATLTASADGVARILVEARVIDASQADPATVRELWAGILENVCGRLGGRLRPPAPEPFGPMEVCTLRLNDAAMALAVTMKTETADETAAAPDREGRRAEGNYDLLLEVELDASVRFGSREMELRELLELGPGDVVELDRHVNDPVDLIIGDKIVARGEVVLMNGNFGLRVTEVAEPVRRLESIRSLV